MRDHAPATFDHREEVEERRIRSSPSAGRICSASAHSTGSSLCGCPHLRAGSSWIRRPSLPHGFRETNQARSRWRCVSTSRCHGACSRNRPSRSATAGNRPAEVPFSLPGWPGGAHTRVAAPSPRLVARLRCRRSRSPSTRGPWPTPHRPSPTPATPNHVYARPQCRHTRAEPSLGWRILGPVSTPTPSPGAIRVPGTSEPPAAFRLAGASRLSRHGARPKGFEPLTF